MILQASTMRVIFALHNQLPFDYLIPLRHQFRGSRSILFLDQSLATHKSAAAAQSSPTMVWNMVMNEVYQQNSRSPHMMSRLADASREQSERNSPKSIPLLVRNGLKFWRSFPAKKLPEHSFNTTTTGKNFDFYFGIPSVESTAC